MSGVTKKLISASGGVAGGLETAIEEAFSTYLYTGSGSTQTFTNYIDLAGEGGLLWVKSRSQSAASNPTGAAGRHVLYHKDGSTEQAFFDGGTATTEPAFSTTVPFNSDGFNIDGAAINTSGETYVAWTFRKAPRFFDVVTWTGDGTSSMTIPHSLGSDVGSIFIKRTDASESWWVVHRSVGDFTGYGVLNTTLAFASNSGVTSVTDSSFTVNEYYSNSDKTYVAYLFAHDPLGPSGDGSDGLIDCGSWDATGNNEVNLGWEPQWILIKNADGTNAWGVFDTMRGWTANGDMKNLRPNASNSETSESGVIKPTATGFTWIPNVSGSTYIYIAIRRGPMRAPTSGTEVFAVNRPVEASGVELRTQSGVTVDAIFHRPRISTSVETHVLSRLTGDGRFLVTSGTSAEENLSSFPFWKFDNNEYAYIPSNGYFNNSGGFGLGSALYAFRRAPKFFDVVAYTGTGVRPLQLNHNLGAVPELMIVKTRNRTDPTPWFVYSSALGNTNYLNLNTTAAAASSASAWSNTTPTDTTFTVGDFDGVNGSSSLTYIAYLFSSLAGVSKVGSYTGNGSSQTINCGFTTGARFVLIKRTNAAGDWYVWDTARGIVAGNDPHLSLNTTADEVTTDDSVDPDSSGFIVNQVAATNINVSAASYIFYAVA